MEFGGRDPGRHCKIFDLLTALAILTFGTSRPRACCCQSLPYMARACTMFLSLEDGEPIRLNAGLKGRTADFQLRSANAAPSHSEVYASSTRSSGRRYVRGAYRRSVDTTASAGTLTSNLPFVVLGLHGPVNAAQ